MTERVVATLDKCKLSHRDSVHLIAAVAEALQQDLSTLILNKSSFHDYREKVRQLKAENIKKVFTGTELNCATIHWDGKMLPNLLKRKVLDRLPVVITNGETEKLLGVPELNSCTGEAQAEAVLEVVDDWGFDNSIKSLCCDTTASNLGPWKGAAALLEKKLERELLWLPCRHHILEILLRSVFESKMAASSGPDVTLFKRFREFWPNIGQSTYKSGLENEYVRNILGHRADGINNFLSQTLLDRQPRDDYKEFLELCQLFLGFIPSGGAKFRYPGAVHHARWMAKGIYSLKMYLFRGSFNLTDREEKGLLDICIFVVDVYVRAWYSAPLAHNAPYNDLLLVKELHSFQSIDPVIS